MLNKKKLLIISIIAIFLVAMSLSAVSASNNKKVKSVTLKINKNYNCIKLKNGDSIEYTYESKKNKPCPQGVHIGALYLKKGDVQYPKHTKFIKATVWFKKKHKIIKKSSTKVIGSGVSINLVKGYKPYKLKAWYKTK